MYGCVFENLAFLFQIPFFLFFFLMPLSCYRFKCILYECLHVYSYKCVCKRVFFLRSLKIRLNQGYHLLCQYLYTALTINIVVVVVAVAVAVAVAIAIAVVVRVAICCQVFILDNLANISKENERKSR